MIASTVPRPHRLDRQAYKGRRRYFLTICTHKRSPHFVEGTTVESTAAQLIRLAPQFELQIIAYCFMPDHLHLLLLATAASSDLVPFIRLFKQMTGFAFKQARQAQLWQESYVEHVIRDDRSKTATIAYIIENPIRAGLVKSPAEYPHWGSQTWSRGEIIDFVATGVQVRRV